MRTSLNVIIVAAAIATLAVVLQAEKTAPRKYKIHKFLDDRDEWLDSMYDIPTDGKALTEEISKFALAESISTVRNIKTNQCKRSVVRSNRRAVLGDMPNQYPASCPKDGGAKKGNPGNSNVIFVSGTKDVKRAERVIEATAMARNKPWKKPEQFVLVVDESGDKEKDAKTMEKAQKLSMRVTHTQVMTFQEATDGGLPIPGNYEKVSIKPRHGTAPKIRFAFSLFVSPNDPLWRIHRVISAIYSEYDYFFVHVDAMQTYSSEKEQQDKSDEAKEALQAVMDVMAPMVAKGNMRVEPIFDVSWGGTSMLNAELAMAEALLEMGDWDYWINLSSTDYPLKPLDKLREWIGKPGNWGKNYGWGAYQDPDDDEKNQGLKSTFYECEGHSFRVNDVFPIPRGVKLYGGSSWFLLHRPFVKFIDSCLDVGFMNRKTAGECSTALMLLDYGQYKINFEEVFYQTVQANTGYCEIQVNEDLRFINWAKDRDDLHTGCMHWEEVDWCGNSPQVMTEDKWDEGSGKEDRFFSRKYENPDVFDYIDSKLGLNSSVGMSPKLAEAMHKSKVKLLDPKGKNIALNKPAFASSNQVNDDGKSFHAFNAVDGNKHTRWSSDHEDKQHFTIKLADNKAPLCNVTEVRILWETAYAIEYSLSMSEDMEKWSKVHETTQESRGRPKTQKELTHVIPINGGKGAITAGLKLDLTMRATRWGFSIWEFEAYGDCSGVYDTSVIDDII